MGMKCDQYVMLKHMPKCTSWKCPEESSSWPRNAHTHWGGLSCKVRFSRNLEASSDLPLLCSRWISFEPAGSPHFLPLQICKVWSSLFWSLRQLVEHDVQDISQCSNYISHLNKLTRLLISDLKLVQVQVLFQQALTWSLACILLGGSVDLNCFLIAFLGSEEILGHLLVVHPQPAECCRLQQPHNTL